MLESSITRDIKDSINILQEQKEFDYCLLLYVKNMINKSKQAKDKESDNNFNFFDDLNEEEKINDLINQINNDKNGENYLELMRIIHLSAKDKLSENKIIEAACIFLSINQITLTIKLLISLSQFELAFYLMDISQDYLYEDIIYIYLLKHSIKMNNYRNHILLINICPNKKIKIKLYQLLVNKNIKLEPKELKEYNDLINEIKNNNDKDNEINLFLKFNNNIGETLPEIIEKHYNNLLKELYEEKLKIETLIEINELFNVIRIYNFEIDLKNENKKINVKKKILLIIIFLET